MNSTGKIVETVDKESAGLLDRISQEDGITKEELVDKVLAISHGDVVRTHQTQQTPNKDKQ